MPLSLTQTIPPMLEPVSVPELKAHLRIETADEDALLAAYISVAREDVENALRRQVLPATWVLALDDWPDEETCYIIRLPRPPCRSVTHVKYYDGNGTLQTFASAAYQVDLLSEPARLTLTDGYTWPSLQSDRINAIQITYEAGYASIAHVPWGIRHMVKLIAGDLYERREARIELGRGVSQIDDNPTLSRLLWQYRLLEV